MTNKALEKAILTQFRAHKLKDDICYLVGAAVVQIGEGRKPLDLDKSYSAYAQSLPKGIAVYSKQKYRELYSFLCPDAQREMREQILMEFPGKIMTYCITRIDAGGWCDRRVDQLIAQNKVAVHELAES